MSKLYRRRLGRFQAVASPKSPHAPVAARKPAPVPPNSSSRIDGLAHGKPEEPRLFGTSPRVGRFARWFNNTIDRL